MRPLFCVKENKTSFVHLGRNPRKRKKHTKSKQKKAKHKKKIIHSVKILSS